MSRALFTMRLFKWIVGLAIVPAVLSAPTSSLSTTGPTLFPSPSATNQTGCYPLSFSPASSGTNIQSDCVGSPVTTPPPTATTTSGPTITPSSTSSSTQLLIQVFVTRVSNEIPAASSGLPALQVNPADIETAQIVEQHTNSAKNGWWPALLCNLSHTLIIYFSRSR